MISLCIVYFSIILSLLLQVHGREWITHESAFNLFVSSRHLRIGAFDNISELCSCTFRICTPVFMYVCVSLYAACVAARTACHLRPRTCACRVNCVASLSHEDRSERNNAKRMSTYQSEVINLYFKKNCSSQIYFNSKFTILLALDFFFAIRFNAPFIYLNYAQICF